jgi:hypothetical protein
MGTLGSLPIVEENPKLVKHVDKIHYVFETYIMFMNTLIEERRYCAYLRERDRPINFKSAKIIHRLKDIKPLPL